MPNKNLTEILPIEGYIEYLQTLTGNKDTTTAALETELSDTVKAVSEGVRRVKLTFNRSGVKRQWVR